MRRIVAAMIAHPDLVGGTGRSDTIMMREAAGRAATKAGAEGYYVAILPKDGLGIALKIDDGAGRASEAAMAALLLRYGAVEPGGETEKLARGPVTNTRDAVVGEKRPTVALIA
jgi:L-asparaginase II